MLNLKELREEKGLFQKDLAKILNKTPTTICDWERGRSQPDIQSLIKMAEFFEVTVDYLVDREGEDGTVVFWGNKTSPEEDKLLSNLRILNPKAKDMAYKFIEYLTLLEK